jgi:transposase
MPSMGSHLPNTSRYNVCLGLTGHESKRPPPNRSENPFAGSSAKYLGQKERKGIKKVNNEQLEKDLQCQVRLYGRENQLKALGSVAIYLADRSAILTNDNDLVQDFLVMVHKREGHRLDSWLEQVSTSDLSELQSFANGVERDKAAVQAGLTWWINNGVVEGSVTKVKLIKRQMYGRASFALLRQRVLHAF